MMSTPARSMSRIAVSAASSNISSRSPSPKSPRSRARTEANHQPGFPWEPTTALGIRGSVMARILLGRASRRTSRGWGPAVRGERSSYPGVSSRRAPNYAQHGAVAPGVVGRAGEDDLAALDDVEPGRVLGNVVDVGLGDQDRVAESGDLGDAVAHGRDDRRGEALEGLVEQQHLRVERQRARDREHLAPPSAHPRA